MRKQNWIVIWPAYFDSARTRAAGRRVPKEMAVPSPKIREIEEALKRMRVQYKTVSDTTYPKTPTGGSGMILVAKTSRKQRVVREIAERVSKSRQSSRSL